VNKFDSYVRKLEKPDNAAWSDDKKVREFKKRVTNEDYYYTEKRVHNSNLDGILVKTFCKHGQDLDKDAILGKDKIPCFRRNGDDDQEDSNQGGTILV
jgi:hypothetical protein